MKIKQEYKDLIPKLTIEEYKQLENNIIAEGCRDAIILVDDVIIDGHNRYEICTKNSIEFKTITKEFESEYAVINWIINNQLGRRNITEEQKSYLRGKRYAAEKQEHGGQTPKKGEEKSSLPFTNTAQKLAEEFNVSDRTIKNDELFAKGADAIPELKESILSGKGELNKKNVQDIGKKLKDEDKITEELKQKAIDEEAKRLIEIEAKRRADEIVKEELKRISVEKQEAKDKKKSDRLDSIQRQRDAIDNGDIKLPEGKFEVIVIDPPWNYNRDYDPDVVRVASPYPEMTQEQLLKIELPANDDSVLFLWTTHKFIFDAKELMDKWGYTYKASLVWDKELLGMGAWLRMQCEFCLVGIKGKPSWNNTTWRDIIREKRREHSRKPEGFYKLVEEITIGRRLDYFSRTNRKGWDNYGNDTEKF